MQQTIPSEPSAPPVPDDGSHIAIALLLMAAATLALALMHGCVRYLSAELDTYTLAFFRNVFGLLAVMPLVLRNGLSSLKTRRFNLHALRGGTGLLAMLLWFQALGSVPIATATALSFTAALFTTVAAVIFLHERVRARRILAIVVGLLGVLIVLRPASDSFNSSSLLVLGSTMFWGTSVVIVKALSRTENTASIVAWNGILLSLLSLPFALWANNWPNLDQLLVLLVIGVLGTIGHLCMVSALSRAEPTAIMPLDFLRLIWTVAIGAWWFSDPLDSWTIVGALVIFCSGLYILFRESQLQTPTSAEAAKTSAATDLR